MMQPPDDVSPIALGSSEKRDQRRMDGMMNQQTMQFLPIGPGQMPYINPHYQNIPTHQSMGNGPAMFPYLEVPYGQTPYRVPQANMSASLQYSNSFARDTNQDIIQVDPTIPLDNTYLASPMPDPANDSWFTPAQQNQHSLLKPGNLGPDVSNLGEGENGTLREISNQIKFHQKRINDRHSKGDEVGRNNSLRELVTHTIDNLHGMINNSTLDTMRERRQAVNILKHVLDVITDCKTVSQSNAIFGYFFLEVTNLIAQLLNTDGDVEGSLQYLLQALEHTKIINAVHTNYQISNLQRYDLIHSTIVPELLWNISQAQNHLNQLKEALKSSKMCYDQAMTRVNVTQMRLRDPNLDNQSRYKLSQLVDSLYRYQFKAKISKGKINAQMKKYQKATDEFQSCMSELQLVPFFQGQQQMSQEVSDLLRRVFEEIKTDKLRQFETENYKIEDEKRKIRQKINQIENEQYDQVAERKRSSSPEHETKSLMKDENDIISLDGQAASNFQDKTISKRVKTDVGVMQVTEKFSGSRTIDNTIIREIQRLRQDMKTKEIDTVNKKIDNMKFKQSQAEQLVLDQLEQQRRILMEQQEVRFREEIGQYRIQNEHRYNYTGMQQQFNPPPQSNPQLGRPIYDPFFRCWTFPYAQNNPLIIYDQANMNKPKIVKKPKKKRPPPPAPVERFEVRTQTRADKNTGTIEDKGCDAIPPPEGKPAISQTNPRISKSKACKIIVRFFRMIVFRKRYLKFKKARGLLLSRSYGYNYINGGLEILQVCVIPNYIDGKCMFIRFYTFDCATLIFSYIDAQFENIQKFTAQRFVQLAIKVLKPVPFERQPYKQHIIIIKQLITDNLPREPIPDPSSSSSSSSDDEKEPPVPVYKKPLDNSNIHPQVYNLSVVESNKPKPAPKPDGIDPPEDYSLPDGANSKLIIFDDEEESSIQHSEPLPLPHDNSIFASVNKSVYVKCKKSDIADPFFGKCQFMVTLRKMKISEVKDYIRPSDADPDQDEFFRLEAIESELSYLQRTRMDGCRSLERMQKYVDYWRLRLPSPEKEKNKDMLQTYLRLGLVIEVITEGNKTCNFETLKLLRLKLNPGADIQQEREKCKLKCNLIIDFPLMEEQILWRSEKNKNNKDPIIDEKHPVYEQNVFWCKVYRRAQIVEFEPGKQIKYKDYKIKVEQYIIKSDVGIQIKHVDQLREAIKKSEKISDDVMILYKLPCSRFQDRIRQWFQQENQFHVQMNEFTFPATIKYLKLTFNSQKNKRVFVFSQQCFDYSLEGLDQDKSANEEFSSNEQDFIKKHRRKDIIRNQIDENYFFSQRYTDNDSQKISQIMLNRIPRAKEEVKANGERLIDQQEGQNDREFYSEQLINLGGQTDINELTAFYRVRISTVGPIKHENRVIAFKKEFCYKYQDLYDKMIKNHYRRESQFKRLVGDEDPISDDTDDENNLEYRSSWAWDQDELAKIQLQSSELGEIDTINKRYKQFRIMDTSSNENVKTFMMKEEDFDKAMDSEKEHGLNDLQAVINNTLLVQQCYDLNPNIKHVGFRIRKNYDKPELRVQYEEQDQIARMYIGQDENRKNEKEIVSTMYNMYDKNDNVDCGINQGIFIVTCFLGNYNIRAQIWMPKVEIKPQKVENVEQGFKQIVKAYQAQNNDMYNEYLDKCVQVNLSDKGDQTRIVKIKLSDDIKNFQIYRLEISYINNFIERIKHFFNDDLENDNDKKEKIRQTLQKEGINKICKLDQFKKVCKRIYQTELPQDKHVQVLYNALARLYDPFSKEIDDAQTLFYNVFIEEIQLEFYEILKNYDQIMVKTVPF